MRDFVRLLRYISKMRPDAALVSEVRREQLQLAQGYFLAEWAGQPPNRDLWRFIRGMQNRAPFSDVLPEGAGGGVEYSWNGRDARAVGGAHLMDGVLVSLLVDDCWDVPWARVVRTTLAESEDGGATVQDDEVDVRHAATTDHADVHAEWLQQAGVPCLRSGAELWESREGLFPHLQFLPRVEKHIRDLRPDWVTPVALELRRIDAAIADWDPALRPFPTWRSLITPEHEHRRAFCTFTDLDGTKRIFDLHGRFTPGAGRIHFRLVTRERKARIAHVGLKIGI